jgi:HTH-type transcriptional regulator/antitoxin HigA
MTQQTKAKEAGINVPDVWFDLLVGLYDLRPIHTKKEHETALKALKIIMRLPNRNLDQNDYMKQLANTIADYEAQKLRIENKDDPVGNLKFLIEQHNMSSSDLGRLLGSRSLGSLILNGHRNLSKEHIRKLSKHFHVNPSVFL